MNNKDSHCGMHTEKERGGKRGRGRGKQRQSNSILYLGDTTKSFLCLPACLRWLLAACLFTKRVGGHKCLTHTDTRTHT